MYIFCTYLLTLLLALGNSKQHAKHTYNSPVLKMCHHLRLVSRFQRLYKYSGTGCERVIYISYGKSLERSHKAVENEYLYARLYFCAHCFCPKWKLFTFLEFTPTPRQMPRDVTNISWAAEQTFASSRSFGVISWASFWRKNSPFGLWEGALSLSKSPLKVKRDIFTRKWMR